MKEGIDLGKRIREYVEIVEFLKRVGENEELHITEQHIYITNKRLKELLEQPPYGKYEETCRKLKIWKKLQWIDAPEKRITTQLRIGNKRFQRVKINREVAETLLELGGRNYREDEGGTYNG